MVKKNKQNQQMKTIIESLRVWKEFNHLFQ